jgi:hypothetical protein
VAYLERAQIENTGAYEAACADAVVAEFEFPGVQAWLRDTARVLRAVTLEGSYPDTRLIVVIADGRFGKDRRFEYRLWKSGAGMGLSEDLQPDPDLMASNIFTWAMEE